MFQHHLIDSPRPSTPSPQDGDYTPEKPAGFRGKIFLKSIFDKKWFFVLTVLLLAMAGCNFNSGPEGGFTPTAQPSTTATLTLTASPVPSPTNTEIPQLATLPASLTPLPPTETPTPTETLGPYEHEVKAGENLISIVGQYGYHDLNVIAEVVALNNLPSADAITVGQVIRIPRQTPTPIPVGIEMTQTADANVGVDATTGARLPRDTQIVCYTVQEGDTIVGIAQNYSTTIETLSQLNPDLGWYGCNFSNYSGGPDCKPSIKPGDCIHVPAPTPTPTLSPTPSGSETPTLTPTFPAPMVVFPPEGATAAATTFRLQWVSVGVLAENEFYLVQVIDAATNAQFLQVTKNTFMDLPDNMIPTDGKTHTMQWTVSVASPNEQGVYRVVGGTSPLHTFQWQSR